MYNIGKSNKGVQKDTSDWRTKVNKGISIIGISAIGKELKDIDEYWTGILRGKCRRSMDRLENGDMSAKQIVQWALQAAKQALFSANFYGENALLFDRERTGVILAVHPNETGLSELVAEELNLHGTCYSIDVAGAGSLAAIKYAVSEIACGSCDMVLTGGLNLVKIKHDSGCDTENMTVNGMGMLLLKRAEETDKPYGFVSLSETVEDSVIIEHVDFNYMGIILQLVMGLQHKMRPCFMADSEGRTQFVPWIVNQNNPIRSAAVRFPRSATYLVLKEFENEHKGSYRLHKMPSMVVLRGETKDALIDACTILIEEMKYNEKAYLSEEYMNPFIGENEVRLGFVALDSQDAVGKLRDALRKLFEHEEEEDWESETLFYRYRGIDRAGKVVTIFSGSSKVRKNMFVELALQYPVYRETITLFDNTRMEHGLMYLSPVLYPSAVQENETVKRNAAEHRVLEEHAKQIMEGVCCAVFAILQRRGFSTDYFLEYGFENRACIRVGTKCAEKRTAEKKTPGEEWMKADLETCIKKVYEDGARVFVGIGADMELERKIQDIFLKIQNNSQKKNVIFLPIREDLTYASFVPLEMICMKLKVLGITIEKDPYPIQLDVKMKKQFFAIDTIL